MAYVISDACVSCGSCADACPMGAISQGDSQYVIDANTCIDCGSCADTCPTGAISQGCFGQSHTYATKTAAPVGRRCFFRSRGYPTSRRERTGPGPYRPPIKVATRPMRQDVKMGVITVRTNIGR